jgi:hypothetical protein
MPPHHITMSGNKAYILLWIRWEIITIAHLMEKWYITKNNIS